MCISSVVCLIMGEGKICRMKCSLDTLPYHRGFERLLMPTFMKTGDSLLMSFMQFSDVFRHLSSTRLPQFNSNTEKFVPRVFQECSHMNMSRNIWMLLGQLWNAITYRVMNKSLNHTVKREETCFSYYAAENKWQSQ
jgi:hypothetical protein